MEIKRSRVDAVAQARRRGAIVKDVALVRPAHGTMNLRASHEEAAILFGLDVPLVNWFVEAWPTRTGVELRLGAKERRAAANAAIDAFFFVVPVPARKSPLGAFLPRDSVLLGSKLLTPFFVSLSHFIYHKVILPSVFGPTLLVRNMN